jgi:hypothetical protein
MSTKRKYAESTSDKGHGMSYKGTVKKVAAEIVDFDEAFGLLEGPQEPAQYATDGDEVCSLLASTPFTYRTYL